LRCRVVEGQKGEDGEHKWSVKQWSGSRSKCPGNLVVSKLFVFVGSDSTSHKIDSRRDATGGEVGLVPTDVFHN